MSNEETMTLAERLKRYYKALEISYPKFHKMDLLSKLAIICSEQVSFNLCPSSVEIDGEKVGVFLMNRSASMYTDEKYIEATFTDQGLHANPALFVYTLPNIMLGEVSIRHGFKGEQGMWISDAFDSEFITKYVLSLFRSNKIDSCLVGWIDFIDNEPQAFLSWVSNEIQRDLKKEHFTSKALQNKYNRITAYGTDDR